MSGDDLAMRPYKGPESYTTEDSHLFSGRDREARELLDLILSSRCTLLHAGSGLGKSSLLSARIIPDLERRDFIPIKILPQDDPIDSTRRATLRYLLPPLEVECLAIERSLKLLEPRQKNPTLLELTRCYRALPGYDPRRLSVISPLEWNVSTEDVTSFMTGSITPFVVRVLRSTVDIAAFAEHLLAILLLEGCDPSAIESIDADTPVGKLLDLLLQPTLVKAHKELVARLSAPVSDLASFFQAVQEVYGERRSKFYPVLLFDQFEELFTRFVDTGPHAPHSLPDWRLKWKFLEEISQLYDDVESASVGIHALKFVISIRSDFIADLEPLSTKIPSLYENMYQLSPLSISSALEVLRKPAKYFNYRHSDHLEHTIVRDLAKEERFIEPLHLQIVLDSLYWNLGPGEAEAAPSVPTLSDELHQPRFIDLDTYHRLGGIRSILERYVLGFLDGLDEKDSAKSLAILESLITTGGLRNIVSYDELARSAGGDTEHRRRLLELLEESDVIRTETRHGSRFVTISHDFLISPIREMIRITALKADRSVESTWPERDLDTLDKELNAARAKVDTAAQYYSCFISYSHADQDFAHRVYEGLKRRAIDCWLDSHQLLPGDDIYDSVEQGIWLWDKVLLCCSEASLTSWWVDDEIRKALAKERQLHSERGERVLSIIPLNLDGYLLESWKDGKAQLIKDRLAADFTGWETDNAKFEEQFEKVTKALRADEGARVKAPKSRL